MPLAAAFSLKVSAAIDDPTGAGPPEWVDDLSPIEPADWTYARAAHLIERAGFGATPLEINRLAAMTPGEAVDRLVEYEAIAHTPKPFDESGIWDPGMDPFPPSRAEAVRLAQVRGEALGVKVLPDGAQRRLQPVVDKFFYGLAANNFETQRLGLWWANRMLDHAAAARGEADAVLARSLRHRGEQGPRLPDDAAAEHDAARARLGTPARPAGRRS